MKKYLLLLLTLALVLSAFASCDMSTPDSTTDTNNTTQTNATTSPNHTTSNSSNTTDTTSNTTESTDDKAVTNENFTIPSDEEPALYTVTQTSDDGLKLEVTLHGYKSESLNKDFYVKNNEYFTVDVKVTSGSDISLYQHLPTYCRDLIHDPSHNHEIGFDLSHEEYKLHSSSFGYVCPEMIDCWEIKAGQSYEWTLKLAAGETLNDGPNDLPGDFSAMSPNMGIKLYNEDIFIDNICVFEGSIFFDYSKNKDTFGNDFSISVPLSIEVVYVSHIPNK